MQLITLMTLITIDYVDYADYGSFLLMTIPLQDWPILANSDRLSRLQQSRRFAGVSFLRARTGWGIISVITVISRITLGSAIMVITATTARSCLTTRLVRITLFDLAVPLRWRLHMPLTPLH